MDKKVELTDEEVLEQVDGGRSRYNRTKEDITTAFVVPTGKSNKQKSTKKVSK